MTEIPQALAHMRPPNKMDELGIPRSLIEDLFLRRLLSERMATVQQISVALCIRASVGREISEELRDKHLLEYHGLEGRDYRCGLTEMGVKMALERTAQTSYAEAAPVSLAQYTATVNSQKASLIVNRESIRAAFSDLVVEDSMLDQLGPAFMNDGAIFLYGPPGTGKTSLAERMIRIHTDFVLIPHAVTHDSAIITVYDPAIHRALPEQPVDLDPRWVACERPLVIVGGEMDKRMLELEHDAVSGVYTAPIQMLANNGILVVDDFGRQTFRPDELLNRWIMPLARGIDFLKIASGAKLTVPFELKLVASTNLDPNSLGDDAFLRRLRNKVFVGPISENAFNWILVRMAKAKGIEVNADDAAYLRNVAIHQIGELRPYIVADFCDLMEGVCAYEQMPKKLDRHMIDRVADVYFVNEAKGQATVQRKDASGAFTPSAPVAQVPGAQPAAAHQAAPAQHLAHQQPVPQPQHV
jgi:hypothetical protein